MEVLEITIRRRLEAGWSVVVEHMRAGELPRRSEGILALKDEFEEALLELTLRPREYGQYLGEALFQGEIRAAFDRAVGSHRDTPLRVLLVVEAPKLKHLRWERLCAPLRAGGGWDFLLLNQSTPYSQYLPSLTDRRFPAIGRRDLRALVLLADPPVDNRFKLDRFDAEATAASVRNALGEIPHDILGPVSDSVGPATLDELSARITSQHYTLLHIVAHGWYRQPDKNKHEDGETILYLLDQEGQVAPVTATRLIEELDRLGGRRGLPHLCFLATCESARPEAEGALGGLAQRLVRELGIPAVVAMTEKVSIDTAGVLAGAFYHSLRETGLPDQSLVEAFAALQGRLDVTVPALFGRLGGRPLFSNQLDDREDGRPTDAEIRYGLERLEDEFPERAPVLLPELTKQARTVRDTLGADPEALSDESSKARNDALDALDALSQEVLDLTFPAVALDQPIPAYDDRCPFPGLEAFQTDEQKFFFGREKKVDEFTRRLRKERFLAILGGSGSGKSSLTLAGIVPNLKKETEGQGQVLEVRTLTPGAHPEAALARQLDPLLPQDQPALLLVDQFQELFTLCPNPTERKGFLDKLLGAWNDHPNLYLAFTLWADFLGDFAPYPRFKDLLQAYLELLVPMTIQELRSAMEQQAGQVGLRFEADLSHTILTEIGGEPGAMPLLQQALRGLWERRHGRWLRSSEYRDQDQVSRVKKAIARMADATYGAIEPHERLIMRFVFERLTRMDLDATDPEQRRDTRRRETLPNLTPEGGDEVVTRKLVARLADARLVVTNVDPQTDETQVEVAHEALIRYWDRLQKWLNTARDSVRLVTRIRSDTKGYFESGENADHLTLRGSMLEEAESLLSASPPRLTGREATFIRLCRKHEKERALEEALTTYAVQIRVIEKNISQGYLAQAKQDLQDLSQSAADFRSFEWNYLWRAANRHSIEFGSGSKDGSDMMTTGVAFLETPNALITNTQNELILWNTQTGTQQWKQRVSDGITSFAYCRQTGEIATAGDGDSGIKIWNAKDGSLLRTLPLVASERRPGSNVWEFDFSEDCKRLAMRGDNEVSIIDAVSGRTIATFLLDADFHANSVAISPDGTKFAVGDDGHTLYLIDSDEADSETHIEPDLSYASALAFSPDGNLLAIGGFDVILWNVRNNAKETSFQGHSNLISDLAFPPNGELLASASEDGSARLWKWNLKQMSEIDSTIGHHAPIDSLAFSNDSRLLATADGDGTIRIWDIDEQRRKWITNGSAVAFSQNGELMATRKGSTVGLVDGITWREYATGRFDDSVWQALFSPAGGVLAVSTESEWKFLSVEDLSLITNVRDLSKHPDSNYPIGAFHPKTGDFFTIDAEQKLVRIETSTGKITQKSAEPLSQASAACFVDQGRLLAVADGLEILVFDPENLQLTKKVKVRGIAYTDWDDEQKDADNDSIHSLNVSPDGTRLVVVNKSGVATLWDVSAFKEVKEFGQDNYFKYGDPPLAFAPDSSILALVRSNQRVDVWDLKSSQPSFNLIGHFEGIESVDFSPDSKRIVTGGIDQAMKVWDATKGRELVSLADVGPISGVRFAPHGDAIVSIHWHDNEHSRVRVWKAASEARIYVDSISEDDRIEFYGDAARLRDRVLESSEPIKVEPTNKLQREYAAEQLLREAVDRSLGADVEQSLLKARAAVSLNPDLTQDVDAFLSRIESIARL